MKPLPKLPRTKKQNDSLHLYFQQVADTLNDAGLDMRKVLKPTVEIPWSKDAVKEHMWQPIQKFLLGKESTTELLRYEDITKVYEVMNRHLAHPKIGIHVPFPNRKDAEEKSLEIEK